MIAELKADRLRYQQERDHYRAVALKSELLPIDKGNEAWVPTPGQRAYEAFARSQRTLVMAYQDFHPEKRAAWEAAATANPAPQTAANPVEPPKAALSEVERFRAELCRALMTSGNEPMKWLARELEKKGDSK